MIQKYMTVHVSGKIKTTVSFPLHAKGGDAGS